VVAVSAILAVVIVEEGAGVCLWPGAYDKLCVTDGQMADIVSCVV